MFSLLLIIHLKMNILLKKRHNMKLPKAVRLSVGFGCLGWSLICIPYAIIKYVNEKELWVLYFGLFAGFLALLTGLFFLIFIKTRPPITKDNVEPSDKPVKDVHIHSVFHSSKPKKEKKPFINEKEWEELEEEDDEAYFAEEIADDD